MRKKSTVLFIGVLAVLMGLAGSALAQQEGNGAYRITKLNVVNPSTGKTLRGLLYQPETAGKLPLVITAHELGSNHQRRWPAYGEALASQGTDPEMEHYGDSIGYHSALRTVLAAFECDIAPCPDLLGSLILLALRCEGESCIHGIRALGGKEKFYAEEFTRLGAEVTIENDCMYVKGGYGKMLVGARVSSHGDHRLAMTLVCARKIATGTISIDDVGCIDRSWPDFPLL